MVPDDDLLLSEDEMKEEVRRLRWRGFISMDDNDDYWKFRYRLEIRRLAKLGYDVKGVLVRRRWR